MFLEEISLKDYRCYAELLNQKLGRLTIFIGENDVGKSVLLDAIQTLTSGKPALPEEFRKINETDSASTFEIEGVFSIESFDTIPVEFRSNQGRSFRIKKTANKTNPLKFEIWCSSACDTRFDSFHGQGADIQRQLLESIGVVPAGNASQRIGQAIEAKNSNIIPSIERMREVSIREIENHLPKFFYTSSSEYKAPDTLIQKTLQETVDTSLNPTVDLKRQEIPALKPIREIIAQALNSRIQVAKEKAKKSMPTLIDLRIEASIDFSKSVTNTTLLINTGEGFRTVEALGEGNKKKLWMGLIEWQRSSIAEEGNINSIRLYDEPDVNLHYDAQRKLYSSIVSPLKVADCRTQIFISTHSVQLIDRAPVESIILLKSGEGGKREAVSIQGDMDEDFKNFFDAVCRNIGLSNSSLFYERAFLIVEGPSEENALPKIYSAIYGHPMIHDGIVLINLEGCGSWKSILKVLQRNKEAQTTMLLDADCLKPNSSGYISTESLTEIGYSSDFVEDKCTYIGTKEFEDAFDNLDILAILEKEFPREDENQWIDADLPLRGDGGVKFSEDIIRLIQKFSIKQNRQKARKPELADFLATQCISSGRIPQKIKDTFEILRGICGAI